ncbi:penicillin-binding protein [Flavobacterium akiainvivens]|uniref:Penicillin-binding protein n=1 Tax=Flavobacterium akiainvivens TaxID=1202724 RepID=A0A0M9VIQ3_9FLAO|nr:transglycosylase domain-containing protein [Flavobacterium akiainvivens]KOS06920.1 penicillin-binding protein [Flavobacterium akiainvivens]SFQ69832.1 penicillin-binding protein 1A [Flavobacterium akiainvivens]
MATVKKQSSEADDFKRYVKNFWKIFGFGFLGIILFFLLASWGVFGHMPDFKQLEDPSYNVATEIISSDGQTLGKFYLENRTPVKFADLPQNLVDALVATEDERFYEHSGIDARGTLRAIFTLGSSGGASTITQQLAKNLFHKRSRNPIMAVVQKAKEWIISTKLERQYTKDEIIAMYLNTVDFTRNAVGIRSASKTYFGKEPKNLKVEEAAVIVGMLKNPSLYNPVSTSEKRRKLIYDRRNVVLGQMVKNGKLSEAEKNKLVGPEIKTNYKPESHKEGIATYFREYLRGFMDKWVKDNPSKDGEQYDIYRDGLKIYVTIDARMQAYAEEAVESHLANLQEEFNIQQKTNKNAPFVNISQAETDRILERAMKNSERWRIMKNDDKSEEQIKASFKVKTDMTIFTWKGEKDTVMTPLDSIRYYKHFLQSGMMSMVPQTGEVKAWVGGINYKHFQYDHVGQGARQVGSTFKPFVYATAIEQLHMSPCDTIIDEPFYMPQGKYGIDAPWNPQNSNNQFRGAVTLKQALAGSINTVSAKLIDKVGPKAVVDMAKNLGVSSKIPEQPAIALGAVEITVSDMVAAYSTFANQGVYIKPRLISKITDKNGVTLYEPKVETHEVVNKEIAYAVIKLLEGVTETGSGARLKWGGGGGTGYNRMTGYPYKIINPIAGKTGTTQNQSDGWFVGMVPNLCTGVWVGNEDRSAHFKGLIYGQGATMALPIWGIYMRKIYDDDQMVYKVSEKPFERPANLSIKVDCWKPPVNDTIAKDSTALPTDEF